MPAAIFLFALIYHIICCLDVVSYVRHRNDADENCAIVPGEHGSLVDRQGLRIPHAYNLAVESITTALEIVASRTASTELMLPVSGDP